MQAVSHMLLLGVAGAIGTIMRAASNTLALRIFGAGVPWGTLLVNVCGSFAFGLIVAWSRSRGGLTPGLETTLLVGLLGGFTTFSTFAFQVIEMLEAGRGGAAVGYMAATNAVALAAVWIGLRLGSL